MKHEKVQGIISTIVTPFNDDDTINESMLRKEVQYLLTTDIDGICACGSTGEGHTLSAEESAKVCKIVVEEVQGKIPVVGGIIQNSTYQVIEYGKALKNVGVDILQVTPVHYLFSTSKEDTIKYFKDIGEAVDLPIIIYNVVPWALASIDTIKELADLPYIIAVKQSAGDMDLLANELAEVKGKISVLAAVDNLHFPAFAMGADGALAALPTVTPNLTIELWNKVRNFKFEEARKLHEDLLKVWNSVKEPNMPAKIKEALRLQGRDCGKPRSPHQPVSNEESKKISEALENVGLLGVKQNK
ncbi:dihydrodipicolinate synthase family protein [Salibacterium aidingense]|uniref:dihydrodipicolinate synthase family protein n=1 Tax=Salibacterium aidingense TaxID=384933 RepID=UPI0003F8ECF5|nr:dihydrodipicolinate synthase family protein [Salibacterium aidingense]